MYLNRIELQGFKSFADKTVIEFGRNITSIVGPNGSGKSNISDAIRWVLGEQSIKNLRGSKLEDIIFSGTSQRKSMGFAEVSLVLDNSSRLIDLEFSEITVTRRLFRNGNSECYINMVPCRLKDIHEMFYDTGVGRTGYSVVGQGRIDDILSSKSEERREVFEEASGITKYKLRKQESERKLESTEQNLLRVKDIIAELELQLSPLSLAAEKARKYLSLRDSLKHSEISLFVHNINRLGERMQKLEENIIERDELITEKKKTLADLAEKERLRFNAGKEADQKIKDASDEYHELRNEIERIRAEISVNEEKIKNSEENAARYAEQRELLIKDKVVLSADLSKKEERINSLKRQLVNFNKSLADAEEKYNKLAKHFSEEESIIEKHKEEVLDLMDELADKKLQLNNTKNYIGSLQKRRDEIKSETSSLLSERDMLQTEKAEISKKLDDTDKLINQLVSEKNQAESTVADCRRNADNYRKKISETESALNFSRTRQRALIEMEENLEGYNRSVREVMKRASVEAEFGKGILGPLAKLIEVSSEYTIPVEIALGQVLQNIVTEDEEAAKKAVRFLKSGELGRATFLPVSVIKGSALPQQILTRLKQTQGYICIASEAVKCAAGYRNIVDSYLARTVLAKDLDAAVELSSVSGSDVRIVTMDGDVINRGGAITGGSIKGATQNLLTRAAEIEVLNKKITVYSKELSGLNNYAVETEKSLRAAEINIKEIDESLNAHRITYIREQGNLKQVLNSIERISSKIQMISAESQQLDREQTENKETSGKYEKEISDIETRIKQLRLETEQKSQQQKETRAEYDVLHQDITDFKISVNSINESIRNIDENISGIAAEEKRIMDEVMKLALLSERSAETVFTAKEKKAQLEASVISTEQKLIGKETLVGRLRQEKENLEDSLNASFNEKETLDRDIQDILEERNKTEIRKVKCESEIDMLKNRIWDEYELTYNNCEKIAAPVENAQKMQTEIDSLKTEMRGLGEVNVSAIDDYIKTKERHEFLSLQHQDMIKAGEDLRKVIKEMETIMKRQFIEQFRKINELFNQVFRELFLGGTASIELVDETNVLESPIEIHVQPPGKKLQNMMLLSGGEKAFTAIALLFAIIMLKDTPFCVLDEIDAALDDPNVQRFSEYLRDLTKKTQFILVTHRKGTMESSDVLYGVTSEEKGVSKIVSMKMS